MLLSNRRHILKLLAITPVMACGFQPVYKTGGSATALKDNISFNLIDNREGFLLLSHLEKRLGRGSSAAPYRATVELVIEEDELMLTALTGLVRYKLTGYAKLSVVDAETNQEIFNDKLRDVIGFSGNEETLATTTSRRDATDKLVLSLADAIVLRLSTTAQSWRT